MNADTVIDLVTAALGPISAALPLTAWHRVRDGWGGDGRR
jgi:hypothetical protein